LRGYDDIRTTLGSKTPGESVSIAKTDLPELPPEFSASLLGTPNWIAQPGAVAQYRAPPALHAYDLQDRWKIHRDRYDPEGNPIGHILFDAPELWIATALAAIASWVTYVLARRWEKSKNEEEGGSWLPVIGAFAVGAIVWVVVYTLAAMARVAVGVG
jgi:hypothetical protein